MNLNIKRRFFVLLLCVAATGTLKAQHTGPLDPYPSGTPVNFIRTWEASAPIVESALLVAAPLKDVRMATQYIDGIGRPIQVVMKEGSLETATGNKKDLVTPIEYDIYGREIYKYNPYVASTSTGTLKTTPFTDHTSFMLGIYNSQGDNQSYYTQTAFEKSPLNRPVESFAPGVNWAGTQPQALEANRHSIKMKYWTNTANDVVRIWIVTPAENTFGSYSSTGTYPAGDLFKTVTIDEHNKQVIEFKDKDGKVILKKVQMSTTVGTADDGTGRGHDGWLCTYYLYDADNNLQAVIQPKAVGKMDTDADWTITPYLGDLCFRYGYDKLNRMTIKQVPGAKPVYMIYDGRDRVVMTQDGNTRGTNQWLVTKYDVSSRPIETGLWTSTISFTDHLGFAYSSTSYPVTSGTYNKLTVTHYDDYSGLPAGLSAYLTTWDTDFAPTSNTNWPYPQKPVKTDDVYGKITWVQTKILGTANFLSTVNYYDDKGRVIQVQSTNITGGTDVTTNQYSWAGQVLESVQQQVKADGVPQTAVICTKMTYDDLGRQIKIEKKQKHTLVNSNAMSNYKIISQNKYNKLGQLFTKELGSSNLQTLTYEYNVRGWLLGMNRDYLTSTGENGTTRFGFELGYDKLTNSGGNSYAAAQYNGNISGTIWKSDGDDVKRKYDYGYDPAGRILKGVFVQDNGIGGTWNSTSMNYSMQMGDGVTGASAYDANGNIKAMKQYGFKPGAPASLIDDLLYTYIGESNQLKNVTDQLNDVQTKMGDFRTSGFHMLNFPVRSTTQDYTYDDNGNMLKDLNKDIKSIAYNYLNLPGYITIDNGNMGVGGPVEKGHVTYTYDAGGNKLKKVVDERLGDMALPDKNTLYLSGLVYQDDVLQFAGHEEGRIRFKPIEGSVPASLEYDYFIKDHLGNVRMVLTEEVKEDIYPTLSFEGTGGTVEITKQNQAWEKADGTNFDVINRRTTVAALQNATTLVPPTLTYSMLVRSSTGKIGAGKLIKVMDGDKIHTTVQYHFSQNTGGVTGTGLSTLVAGLTSLLTNSVYPSGMIKDNATSVTSGVNVDANVSSFFTQQETNSSSSSPKAYLNVLFFDEQFKFDNTSSYSEQIGTGTPGQVVIALGSARVAKKSGYCYIYISNETNDMVYFDNLSLKHERGSLLEETHYYPFGLTMAGISSKAAGAIEGNKKFQGQEFAHKEFSDGTGLEMYEFKYRMSDPQTGRFWQVDPLAEKYVYNSTFAFSENKVTSHVEIEGLEAADINVERDVRDVGSGKATATDLENRATARAGTGKVVAVAGSLAAAFFFPPFAEFASLIMVAEISGVPSPGRPTSVVSTGVSDTKAISNTATTAEENSTTIYRGVNESHVGFSDAKAGVVTPKGGTATATEHNLGNTQSQYTSWTSNEAVATNYALRPNGGGVVLKKTVPNSSLIKSPSVKSVNLVQSPGTIVNESEVLLKGKITGAKAHMVSVIN